MGVIINRHNVLSALPTNTTISAATFTPSPSHTATSSTSTPVDSATANSLWADEYKSGTAGKLAGGIDAVLGIVLVVFLAVVIYQWRMRSGKRVEEKEAGLASSKRETAEGSLAGSDAVMEDGSEVLRDKGEGKEEKGVVIAGK
ncbi:hypothetical protein B0T14DRAFT_568154 [Immersiella caudata]|uniref:Uncharacterized protein n=1 Tax=Immersiella caudata TaxID=314043 RepID=A0AA39WJK5_9PEZI|nr:hypothetical protein B0T14DRAFT_568154 [Immersiella caudata]